MSLQNEYETASLSHTLGIAIQDIGFSVSRLIKDLHSTTSYHEAQYHLRRYYFETDPAAFSIAFAGFIVIFTWLLTILTRNVSQMNRLWSILPFLYTTNYSLQIYFVNELRSSRLLLMTFLQFVWCARLTFNYARKGGYMPASEDYRHIALRQMLPGWLFQLFNFFVIAIAQNIVLWSLSMPSYVVYVHARTFPAKETLNFIDFAATLLFIIFFFTCVIADEQQWNYQNRKRNLPIRWQIKLPIFQITSNLKEGFIQSGLFKYSRHPNFASEMMIWWSFYLFSVAASNIWLNYSLNGAACLTLFFSASTWFTELLSERKYGKAYRMYKAGTGRLFPNIWNSNSILPKKAPRQPRHMVTDTRRIISEGKKEK